MKRVWIALAAVLAVILPVRIYTLVALADATTGLYSAKDAGISIAVAIASAAGALLLIGLSAGLKRDLSSADLQSLPAAVLAALVGVAAAGQSLAAIMIPSASGNRGMEVILSVFGLLAGASFLAAAYGFASGSGMLNIHPLLGLLPSVWGCLGLISMFVNYAATVNILENVYHTFTVALLLLFLFSQAKFLAGMEVRQSAKRMLLYGPAAAAAALISSVPAVLRFFSGRAEVGLFPVGMHLICILLAIYIVVYLSAVSRIPQPGPELQFTRPGEYAPDGTHVPQNGDDSGKDGPDTLQSCCEFLKNSYNATEEFVEISENEVSIPKNEEG